MAERRQAPRAADTLLARRKERVELSFLFFYSRGWTAPYGVEKLRRSRVITRKMAEPASRSERSEASDSHSRASSRSFEIIREEARISRGFEAEIPNSRPMTQIAKRSRLIWQIRSVRFPPPPSFLDTCCANSVWLYRYVSINNITKTHSPRPPRCRGERHRSGRKEKKK